MRLTRGVCMMVLLWGAVLPGPGRAEAGGGARATSTTLENGLTLTAPGESPLVLVQLPGFDGRLNLLAPEVVSDQTDRRIYLDSHSTAVAWREREAGGLISSRQEDGIGSYTLALLPAADGVLIDWRICNLGEITWPYGAGTLCLQNHDLPAFYDPTETRSMIHAEDGWRAIADSVERIGTNWLIPPWHRPCGVMQYMLDHNTYQQGIARPDLGLVGLVSAAGGHVIGMGWPEVRYINANTGYGRGSSRHACLDASPYLGDVRAGKTVHVTGKLYFLAGGIEELEAHYRADLADGVVMFEP